MSPRSVPEKMMSRLSRNAQSWASRAGRFTVDPVSSQENTSRLLSLTPELRLLIIEFAVSYKEPLVAFEIDEKRRGYFKEATQPALSRVNRQLRREVLSIFYGCNDFILDIQLPNDLSVHRWLRANEYHLHKLNQLSLWIEVGQPESQNNVCHGIVSLPLCRAKPGQRWESLGECQAITVVRQPGVLMHNAEILQERLGRLLAKRPRTLSTAAAMIQLITELKADSRDQLVTLIRAG